MIRAKDIQRFEARYHRNGVMGKGFHLCSFLYGHGADAVEMRAIVFEDPGSAAVTSDDIDQRWRGDDFEAAIRGAIAAVVSP
jgi:hypothetical protein